MENTRLQVRGDGRPLRTGINARSKDDARRAYGVTLVDRGAP